MHKPPLYVALIKVCKLFEDKKNIEEQKAKNKWNLQKNLKNPEEH